MAKVKKHVLQSLSLLPYPNMEQLINRFKNMVFLPFYHAVSNKELPHIKHLYKVKTEKQFRADLDFILQFFEPVRAEDLLEPELSTNISKPKFHLSFDDGLAEMHEIVRPILLEKGVPATFFINTDFVDNKNLFFRYNVSLLIEKVLNTEGKNRLDIESKIKQVLEDSKLREASGWKDSLLKLRYHDAFILNELNQLLEMERDKHSIYMTSHQIKELIADGFSIGAHSLNHPEYQYIDFEEQKRQTKESMKFLVDKFDVKHRFFAFPFTDFGVSQDFLNWIHHEENEIAELTFGCAGMKSTGIKGHWQRVPMEEKPWDARKKIKSEYLYHWIIRILGQEEVKYNSLSKHSKA